MYTKEELQQICNESTSIREVSLRLGYSADGGGSIYNVKSLLKELNLDISHFTGQSHSKNLGRRVHPIEDYFSGKVKIRSHMLRLRLIEEKYFEEKCYKCGNVYWLEYKMPLELHHIDGNKNNNSLDNLQLLCPNCHVFTDTYKSKNRSE